MKTISQQIGRRASVLVTLTLLACSSQLQTREIRRGQLHVRNYGDLQSQPAEAIRSYLLKNYFNQPDNSSLVCFEGDSGCAIDAIKVREDLQYAGFIGVGSCMSGNCDYFLFGRSNGYAEPMLEVSGYAITFEKARFGEPADVDVIVEMRADPATQYKVRYSYSSGSYLPEKCFVNRYVAGTELDWQRIECASIDGQL